MPMVMDLTREASQRLAVALGLHRRWSATNGLRVPQELVDLEAACARRVMEGQESSSLAEVVELIESQTMTRRLVTYTEAATMLACSLSTVKRLVASEELRCVRIGESPRLRVSDIDTYLDSLCDRELA